MRTFVSGVSVDELIWVDETVGNIIDELKGLKFFGGVKFDDYPGNLRLEFLCYTKRRQPGKTKVIICFPADEADKHIVHSTYFALPPNYVDNTPIIEGAKFDDCSELVVQRLRPILSLWKNYRKIFHTSKMLSMPDEVQIEIWEFQISK